VLTSLSAMLVIKKFGIVNKASQDCVLLDVPFLYLSCFCFTCIGTLFIFLLLSYDQMMNKKFKNRVRQNGTISYFIFTLTMMLTCTLTVGWGDAQHEHLMTPDKNVGTKCLKT
jgi:hypothetical protein